MNFAVVGLYLRRQLRRVYAVSPLATGAGDAAANGSLEF